MRTYVCAELMSVPSGCGGINQGRVHVLDAAVEAN